MKRRDLEQHLRKQGCEMLREGARPSEFHNPASGATSTVPRHREINDFLARKIWRDLKVPAPR
jgi:mRNA interferase HicA